MLSAGALNNNSSAISAWTKKKEIKMKKNVIEAIDGLLSFCEKKSETALWPNGPTGTEYAEGLVRVKPDGSNRGSFVEGLDDLDKTVSFLKELDFKQVEVSPEVQYKKSLYFQATLPEGYRAFTGVLTVEGARKKGLDVKVIEGSHGDELQTRGSSLSETNIISVIVDDGMMSTWYPGSFTAANPDPEHKLSADPADWLEELAVKIKLPQTINLGLTNSVLYTGCKIEEVAGRLNLTTSVEEAINIVGRNIAAMEIDSHEVVLTGPMAVWSYLIVFHAVVHKTAKVYYDDGRSGKVLIAAHG